MQAPTDLATNLVHISETATYQLTIPPGWSADPKSTIEMINLRAAEMSGPGVATYVAGFRPIGSAEQWTEWLPEGLVLPADIIAPFVLLQEIPIDTESVTQAQIVDWVRTDLLEEANGASASFDPVTMSVTGRSSQPIPPPTDAGSDAPILVLDAATTGFIGMDRVVYLHAYSDARSSDAVAPTFAEMRESFQFYADAQYVDTPAAAGATAQGPPAMVTAALAVFAIGVIAVGMWRLTRAKAA